MLVLDAYRRGLIENVFIKIFIIFAFHGFVWLFSYCQQGYSMYFALLDVDMYPCIRGCAFLQCRAPPKSRGLCAESAASRIQVFMIEHVSGDSEHLKSPGLPVARTLEAFAFSKTRSRVNSTTASHVMLSMEISDRGTRNILFKSEIKQVSLAHV